MDKFNVNQFISQIDPKFPTYQSDADFTTNAPSYYQELARKNGLIELLAKRIWTYDQELAKRFLEWDQNLEEFDDNVLALLIEWLNNGTLEHIINKDVFGMKADQDGQYVSVKRFGVKADGITDDTEAWQAALDSGEPLAMGTGEHVISAPLRVKVTTRIKGTGIYSSVFRPKGAITLFDGTSPAAKTGVEFKDFGVVGDSISGSKAFDLYYFVNNSHMENIRVERMDIPLTLTKSWYASFKRLYFRSNLSRNLELFAPSTSEQLNALMFLDCKFMFAENNVLIHGDAPMSVIAFVNCTFEASRKTSVISRRASPLIFSNCYFERNYTDALTTDILRVDTPIDLSVDTYSARNNLAIVDSYFSRSDKFVPSTEKTSIYLGGSVQMRMESTNFQCGTSSYIDNDIFSTSQNAPVIRNISRDGFAKSLYKGVQHQYMVAQKMDLNLRYTSSGRFDFIRMDDGSHSFKLIPLTNGNGNAVNWRLRNMLTGATLIDGSFPANLVSGSEHIYRLGTIPRNTHLRLETVNTSGDVDMAVAVVIFREAIY